MMRAASIVPAFALALPALAQVFPSKPIRIKNSLEVSALTPAETGALLKEDRANAARIFKALGVKPEDAPN